MMKNPYEVNDTMRMIGKQNEPYLGPGSDLIAKMDDITSARRYTTTIETACDMVTLGYIYGKKAERKRRNGNSVKGGVENE